MFDLIAAGGVLALLGIVMLLARVFRARLTSEGSRKIIHITMGCAALSFPFIFTYRQSVVYLGVAALAMLLFLRLHKGMREGLGTALLGISRKSFGEIYFVISIVIVFVLHKSAFEYIIPIAVLTFADSVAALIGISYGRYNLADKNEDAKSREGSVMFFIVAFICALTPLQLMTEIGRAEVLVISFLIGLLAAMVETVSANGNDNLLLPLLTYSFIRYNSELPLETLFVNFGVMVVFLALIFFVYKLTNFTRLSIAYSLLVGYIVMILGGVSWVLPPLALLLTFGIFPMMKREERQKIQNYKAIECTTIIGVICLYISVFYPMSRDILYIAFSFSFACHLCINTYCRFKNFVNTSKAVSIICGLGKAFLFIALPALFIARMNWMVFVLYLALLAASMPSAISLDVKFDYKNVRDVPFRASKILIVGTLTSVFVAALTIMEVAWI